MRDSFAEAACCCDHRPAPEPAALRDAAQHHEGEEEAADNGEAGRPRSGCHAAPEDVESRRAAQAPGGRDSAGREDAGREIEERSQGSVRETSMTILVIAEHDNAS